jgi:hypothetical protein
MGVGIALVLAKIRNVSVSLILIRFSWTHLSAACAKEFTLGQARYDKHSAEFRAEAVRLARVARELGVKESTLRRGEGRPA